MVNLGENDAGVRNIQAVGHTLRRVCGARAQIQAIVEKIQAIPDGMSSQARRPSRVRACA